MNTIFSNSVVRLTRRQRRWCITGIILIVIAIVIPHWNALGWYSNGGGTVLDISQANAWCHTAVGQLLSGADTQSASDCASASDWMTFCWVLGLAGFVLAFRQLARGWLQARRVMPE